MDAGAIIAIYAAVVSTGGLSWQIYAWQHGRKSHVRVEVTFGVMSLGANITSLFSITAVNRGSDPVRVESYGLFLQDGSGRKIVNVRPREGATMPGIVPPSDSGWAYVPLAGLEGTIDLNRPVIGWVQLSTGEQVKSAPATAL